MKSITFPTKISGKWEWIMIPNPQLINLPEKYLDTFINYYNISNIMVNNILTNNEYAIPNYMIREKSIVPTFNKQKYFDKIQISPINYITSTVPGYNVTTIIYPTIVDVYLHEIFRSTKLIDSGRKKVIVFSNTLDISYLIINYQTYVTMFYDKSKLVSVIQKMRSNDYAADVSYIVKNKGGKIIYNSSNDINTNNELKKIKSTDLAIIDISSENVTGELNILDSYVSFHQIFSYIILTCKILNLNGTMIIVTGDIIKDEIMDFYIYLSGFFKKTQIYVPYLDNFNINKTIMIFSEYIEKISMSYFSKFNDIIVDAKFENKNNISIKNENDLKIIKDIGIEFNKKPTISYAKNIDKIVNLEITDDIIKFKKHYHNYIRTKYIKNIGYIHNFYSSILSRKFYDKLHMEIFNESIIYCHRIDIGLLDWVNYNGIIKTYYKNQFVLFINSFTNIHKKLTHVDNFKIGIYDKITELDDDFMNLANSLSDINEILYSYVDGSNIKTYKTMKLMVNKCQKNMENFLANNDIMTITTEGHPVSRAWVKLREIYHDTKYFDNLLDKEKNINAFHSFIGFYI